MEVKDIYAELRKLAPHVSFEANREIDPYDVWDGDGPDPRDEGFDAYNVTVRASAVVDGKLIEGDAYLGSSYYKPDEPLDDIHGYLPQKLEEAADALLEQIEDEGLKAELAAANAFLKKEMKDRYDAQRAEIEAERAAKS